MSAFSKICQCTDRQNCCRLRLSNRQNNSGSKALANQRSTQHPELESLRKLLRAFTTSQSSSQWQTAPSASPCRSSGPVTLRDAGSISPSARPSSSSLACGGDSPRGTITPQDKIKLLGGSTGGTATPTLSLTIMEEQSLERWFPWAPQAYIPDLRYRIRYIIQ